MPNTSPAIINQEMLQQELSIASSKAKCDYALFLAATKENADELAKITKSTRVMGVKLYLNNTFGQLCLPSMVDWMSHFEKLPKNIPICAHAEQKTTAAVILMAHLYDRHVHICHVAREEEILVIKKAKERGINVTCEVAPHHLFLTEEDVPEIGKTRANVKPNLVTVNDRQALWDNLHIIDIFATDHAPHLKEEKDSENAPPGYPGLETMLPLLLTAVREGKLSMDDLMKRLYYNPKRIFNLPDQLETYVEIDIDEQWIIPEQLPFTKSKWTPFAGKKVTGRVRRVLLHNEVAFIDESVLVKPGFGHNILQTLEANLFPTNVNNLEVIETNVSSNLSSSQSRKQQATEIYMEMFKELGMNSGESKSHASKQTFLTSQIFHHGLTGKNILSVKNFSKDQLHELFNLAHKLRICVAKEKPLDRGFGPHIPVQNILKGKIMASIFYEASTRTNCSFAAAMQRLGGGVIYMNDETSSVKKGESLEDSVAVMSNYADVVVLRHPEKNAVEKASKVCLKPIINAGDGIGEHPTQALLDVFTIREEIGTVNNLVVRLN